ELRFERAAVLVLEERLHAFDRPLRPHPRREHGLHGGPVARQRLAAELGPERAHVVIHGWSPSCVEGPIVAPTLPTTHAAGHHGCPTCQHTPARPMTCDSRAQGKAVGALMRKPGKCVSSCLVEISAHQASRSRTSIRIIRFDANSALSNFWRMNFAAPDRKPTYSSADQVSSKPRARNRSRLRWKSPPDGTNGPIPRASITGPRWASPPLPQDMSDSRDGLMLSGSTRRAPPRRVPAP